MVTLLIQCCHNVRTMLNSIINNNNNNNVSCKQNNELEKKRLNDWREGTTGKYRIVTPDHINRRIADGCSGRGTVALTGFS